MTLRQTHPNFWLSVVADVVCLGWLGFNFTLLNNTSPSWRYILEVAPLPVFGIGFALASAGIVVGLSKSPMLFRGSLAFGAALATMFSLGLAAAVFDDITARGETPGGGAFAVYLFLAVSLVAQSREPRVNPASQR